MIRKIKKRILGGIVIILLLIIGFGVYNRINQPAISTLPAKIEEIKQAVKLSTLDITTEEIFKDTVNIKGVVSRVRTRVYIHFDIEDIPLTEHGDTLIVQLPPEIIDVYEATTDGFQVLDVWNLQFPDEPVEIPLTNTEENMVKRKLKHRIQNQMYEKGYVKRARENAVHSLAILFSRFRDQVVVIDNYPNGWKHNEQQTVFPEKPNEQI